MKQARFFDASLSQHAIGSGKPLVDYGDVDIGNGLVDKSMKSHV
jgi:hypothetical protein